MQVEDLFGEVIYSYTEEQAIEDGVLVHPYEERFPWVLFTESVHAACIQDFNTNDSRTYDQKALPLIVDAIREVRRILKANPRADLIELEGTIAGTVWVRPNSKGGLTIMKPEDN